MRISDWSSDVCSSDLNFAIRRALLGAAGLGGIDRSARCGDPLHTDIGRQMPGYFRIEISEASGQADRDNGEADPPDLSLPGARLWCERPTLALGGHGYMFGHLFERGEMSRRWLAVHDMVVTRMAAASGQPIEVDYIGERER